MNVADGVNVDPQALISWYTLPGPTKEQILEALVGLAGQPPEWWPGEAVQHLDAPEPVFLLRAADGFRVIFLREEDGQLTVRHIFLQELIDRYFTKQPEPAPTT